MQMSKSSAEAYIRNIESATAASAFLGTPHSGSDFAPFAKAVSRVLSLTGKRVNVNILDTLKRDSQVLLDLEDWFGHWLRRRFQDGSPVDLTCFIEELELPIVGRVVEEHQAKISGYSSFGIHSNHMDMTKFEGDEDPGYKIFRAQITRWVGQIQSRAIKPARVGSEKAKAFLRSLLSRSCPYEDRKNVAETRIPGTCQWFINHERFKHWRDVGQSSLLWVSADPGSGKSVLARYLVDEILQDSTKTLCYFFFKDGFADQQSVTSCLCALLHQLLIQRDDLITQALLDDVEKHGGISNASSYSLWSLFVRIAGSETAGEIICVIDALDECYEDDMSSWIYQIQALFLGAHKSRLKMLFTSRPYQRIQWEFRTLEDLLPTVHLRGEDEDEVGQITKEVDLVIQSRVQALGQRRRLNEDETAHVHGLLTAVPNRTYLWVTLTLYNLEIMPAITRGSALKLVTQLPRTVDEAYESILMKSVDKQRAQKLLHIVLAATRPLTLDEISIALAIEEHHVVDENLANDLEPIERFRDTVRDISGLLLIVVDKKVYLLHQTVREFLVEPLHKPSHLVPSRHSSPLVWKHSFRTGISHKIMAESCFYYISMRTKRDQYQENDGVEEISAFDDYAVNQWVKHFEQSDLDTSEPLAVAILQFCSQFTERLCDNYSDLDPNGDPIDVLFFPYDEDLEVADPSAVVPVLIMAAYFGLLKIVKHLVETSEVDINIRDAGMKSTPLEWAAYKERSSSTKEHVELIRYLTSLDGVELDGSVLQIFGTPKREGFDKGWHAVVDVVLRSGKLDDINWKDHLGRTTLHWAAFSGNMPLLKLLLAADGVDVNAREDDGTTPIMTAVARGNAEVLKTLLALKEVNVNDTNDAGMTPLMFASNFRKMDGQEMIRILLSSGRVDLEFEKNITENVAGQSHRAAITLYARSPFDICTVQSTRYCATTAHN
ncbi:hypothetical protein BKA63DRAFT_27723 [Paraphoma chrysanthemicola]|nr:hypothetical protein BKA63DRAFT_27723 [Paraphoma chrysanthemicola]